MGDDVDTFVTDVHANNISPATLPLLSTRQSKGQRLLVECRFSIRIPELPTFADTMRMLEDVVTHGQQHFPPSLQLSAAAPRPATPPFLRHIVCVPTREAGVWHIVRWWHTTQSLGRFAALLSIPEHCLYLPATAGHAKWTVSHAFELALRRIPGLHVSTSKVQPHPSAREAAGAAASIVPIRSRNSKWAPTPAQLHAGYEYLRGEDCPPDNTDLQQSEWIHLSISTPSPLQGWPLAEVKDLVRQLNELRSGSDFEQNHPLLLTYHCYPTMLRILQLALKYSRHRGWVLGGKSGVGKTPFAKSLAMLMASYWAEIDGVDPSRVGLRLGSKQERFKNAVQQKTHSYVCDDPRLHQWDPTAWRQFLDIGARSASGEGRYSDPKYTQNGFRCITTNTIPYEQNEPNSAQVTADPSVTVTYFTRLWDKLMFGWEESDKWSIFKRCVTLIFGDNHMYLRLPSENPNSPVLSFAYPTDTPDLFRPCAKPILSSLQGLCALPACQNFDEMQIRELEWARPFIEERVVTDNEIPLAGNAATAHVDSTLASSATALVSHIARPPQAASSSRCVRQRVQQAGRSVGEVGAIAEVPTAFDWQPPAQRILDHTNSWIYMPLFLDSAGLLTDSARNAWRSHALCDWWADAVAILQASFPVPREELVNGLRLIADALPNCQVRASARDAVARIAANLSDENITLPLAVRAAVDARGYIPGSIQDALLQTYGDENMTWSREVDRRADAFRQTSSGAPEAIARASQPQPPTPTYQVQFEGAGRTSSKK